MRYYICGQSHEISMVNKKHQFSLKNDFDISTDKFAMGYKYTHGKNKRISVTCDSLKDPIVQLHS